MFFLLFWNLVWFWRKLISLNQQKLVLLHVSAERLWTGIDAGKGMHHPAAVFRLVFTWAGRNGGIIGIVGVTLKLWVDNRFNGQFFLVLLDQRIPIGEWTGIRGLVFLVGLLDCPDWDAQLCFDRTEIHLWPLGELNGGMPFWAASVGSNIKGSTWSTKRFLKSVPLKIHTHKFLQFGGWQSSKVVAVKTVFGITHLDRSRS